MSFPSKTLREKCWASRDEFWKCLDENGDRLDACVAAREFYTNYCPSQWVKHFDRKREYLKFKDQIQGAHHIERDTLTVVNPDELETEGKSKTTKNSSSSPNARIFRKFKPPTF